MSEDEITVVIDVPRGSFIKRGDDQAVDFISPIPSPFNYGHVPGTRADDGDAQDAVVLGARLPLGSAAKVICRARVDFIDAGKPDAKWICADAPLSRFQRRPHHDPRASPRMDLRRRARRSHPQIHPRPQSLPLPRATQKKQKKPDGPGLLNPTRLQSSTGLARKR